jgi:hypothetical protein
VFIGTVDSSVLHDQARGIKSRPQDTLRPTPQICRSLKMRPVIYAILCGTYDQGLVSRSVACPNLTLP